MAHVLIIDDNETMREGITRPVAQGRAVLGVGHRGRPDEEAGADSVVTDLKMGWGPDVAGAVSRSIRCPAIVTPSAPSTWPSRPCASGPWTSRSRSLEVLRL
jgi:hypothetical protein